jgi:hypothetical protein
VFLLVVKKSILYFSSVGEDNTDETLREAQDRAKELGIKDIVVASTRGNTALKAIEVFQGYNVVIVPHVTGLKEPGVQELSTKIQDKIRTGRGKIVIAGHAFSSVNRAIQTKFDTMFPAGIIAQTLRLFGQGMKVVVEIVAMAADAGVIPIDKDVVAIAGTNRGADTAVIIKPANSHRLFDMTIKEIIAKPRL